MSRRILGKDRGKVADRSSMVVNFSLGSQPPLALAAVAVLADSEKESRLILVPSISIVTLVLAEVWLLVDIATGSALSSDPILMLVMAALQKSENTLSPSIIVCDLRDTSWLWDFFMRTSLECKKSRVILDPTFYALLLAKVLENQDTVATHFSGGCTPTNFLIIKRSAVLE